MQTKTQEVYSQRLHERMPADQPPSDGTAAPSISVILPNYNHGKWLGRALEALLSQTVSSLEIVLIDDGSTDNSAEVMTTFCKRFNTIKLIQHGRNRGPYEAVRSGIATARGELLYFAAADDFVLPGFLARAQQALSNYPDAAFFCSKAALFDRGGRLVGQRPVISPRDTSGYVSPTDVRRKIRHSDNWFIGPSVIYRRRLLAELGYFDRALGTLCDGLTQRLLAFRHGFYFDAEVLAVWMIDTASLSAQTSLSEIESRRVIETGRRWITSYFPADVKERYREVFTRRLAFNMARQYLIANKRQLNFDFIFHILGWKPFGLIFMRVLASVPLIGLTLIISFMTLKMKPMSLSALLKSWLREKLIDRHGRAILDEKLMQAFKKGVA